MRFGIYQLVSCAEGQDVHQRYRDTFASSLAADELGYESIWPVEHHFDPRVSVLSCPTLFLAAVASRTSRLRLGTGIVQLPLTHPLRAAEELATLDVLSEGRVEAGVGRGVHPAHFAGFGVPIAESRARFEEGVALLLRAFREERVSFRGRHFDVAGVQIVPRPVQARGPTVRVAANSMETAVFAGRMGLPVLTASHVTPFPKLEGLLGAYREARREAGHAPPAPDDISVVMPLFVAEDRAAIERQLAPGVASYVAMVSSALAPQVASASVPAERERLQALLAGMRATTLASLDASMGVFDTPEGCVERLRALAARFGMGRIIAWFNFGEVLPHAEVMRAMALFAARVMPALQGA
ncbi:LLM class flavin-dependent oxidoreductase [Sorangium sp. So ce385]|uniref:LLM class flavin-dependent oxidoreductase n=1 Tax=Sorangium sp. So ce385 TaxID=3133308 RepID=UPI003F5B15C4